MTGMEKHEILLGWVTKVCQKCATKLGQSRKVTFDNIYDTSVNDIQ